MNAELTTRTGVPLHRQLFLVLHDEIARGALAPGDPLPTEQTLCEQFGVSRITVRRALADLADDGLIERRQGVGSFVKEAGPQRHGTGSYFDELRQTQFETEVEVIELEVRGAPQVVVEHLGSPDRFLYVLRLRRERRTGEPLMVTEAWLPAELADVLTVASLTQAPLYDLLSGAGVELGRIQHEITAEIAGPRMAGLLATAIGAPLLRVNRLAFAGENPHHLLSILLSPNRSRVMLTQPAAELKTGEGIAIAHDVRRT